MGPFFCLCFPQRKKTGLFVSTFPTPPCVYLLERQYLLWVITFTPYCQFLLMKKMYSHDLGLHNVGMNEYSNFHISREMLKRVD